METVALARQRSFSRGWQTRIGTEVTDHGEKGRALTERVRLESDDFWVKVVGMLQQNWALVHTLPSGQTRISFIDDGSQVFDEILCSSLNEAHVSLARNGFERLADNERLRSFLTRPKAPFIRGGHPNGPIYSSGRFWR